MRTFIAYVTPQFVFLADGHLVAGGFSWPKARYFSHRGQITVVAANCILPVTP